LLLADFREEFKDLSDSVLGSLWRGIGLVQPLLSIIDVLSQFLEVILKFA
jgi:hypothetical protein